MPGWPGTGGDGKFIDDGQVALVIGLVLNLKSYSTTGPELALLPLLAGALHVKSIELFVGSMARRSVIWPGRVVSGKPNVVAKTTFDN